MFGKITYLVFSVSVNVLRHQEQDTSQLAAAETLTELTKAMMWSQSNYPLRIRPRFRPFTRQLSSLLCSVFWVPIGPWVRDVVQVSYRLWRHGCVWEAESGCNLILGNPTLFLYRLLDSTKPTPRSAQDVQVQRTRSVGNSDCKFLISRESAFTRCLGICIFVQWCHAALNAFHNFLDRSSNPLKQNVNCVLSPARIFKLHLAMWTITDYV
jgi:hypothetical protein